MDEWSAFNDAAEVLGLSLAADAAEAVEEEVEEEE